VMDEAAATNGTPFMKSLFQGIEDKPGMGGSGLLASRQCGGPRRR
jgi:hypothetical protein